MNMLKTRWLYLVIGCIVFLAIGFTYAWSIFQVPFNDEFGWDASTLSFTFTMLMWSFALGGVVGASITRKTNFRVTMIISAAFFAIAFYGALFVSESTPWILYLTYGLFGGCATGFCYSTIVGVVTQWFPDKPGLASGVLLMCYTFSTVVFGTAATALFNTVGWRFAFKVFGIAVAAIVFVASLLLRAPKPSVALELSRYAKSFEDKKQKKARRQNPDRLPLPHYSYTPGQMLKAPIAWIFFLWMLLVMVNGMGATSFVYQTATQAGATEALAVFCVSLFSISNGVGRPILGAIFDRCKTSTTMLVASVGAFIGSLLFVFGLKANIVPVVVLACIVFPMCGGATSVVASGFAEKFFGTKYHATNFSIINLLLIPAAFIGPRIASVVINATGTLTGSYMCFAIFAVAFIIVSLLFRLFDHNHFAKTAEIVAKEAAERAASDADFEEMADAIAAIEDEEAAKVRALERIRSVDVDIQMEELSNIVTEMQLSEAETTESMEAAAEKAIEEQMVALEDLVANANKAAVRKALEAVATACLAAQVVASNKDLFAES